MRGLILKDSYMVMRYFKIQIAVSLMFVVMTAVTPWNLYCLFFPFFMASLIPATLLSYDERSRWDEYSRTMPYSPAQLVSVKYIMGIISIAVVFVAMVVAVLVSLAAGWAESIGEYIVQLCFLLFVCSIFMSVNITVMFWLGVEKGRIFYVAVVAAFGSVMGVLSVGNQGALPKFLGMLSGLRTAGLVLIGFLVIALSWLLAIKLYRRKRT